MKKLLLYLSRFHWQVIISVLIAAIFWAWLMLCDAGQASLAKLEISNYISVVTGLASIVALFCSGTLLLFLEFSYDVYRQYQEEIDFVGSDSESDSS